MRTLLRQLTVSMATACLSLSCLVQAQAPAPDVGSGDLVKLAALITQKQHRTADEAKLDSNLLFAMRAVMTRRLGNIDALPPYVDAFIASKVKATDGTVAVTIQAAVSSDLLAALSAIGGREIAGFAAYDRITARLPIIELPAIARRSDVRFIAPLEEPYLAPEATAADTADAPAGSVKVQAKNAAVSEGVKAHQADKVHESGIDGTGVMVCVISDGIDSLPARQAAGQMPPIATFGQLGSGDGGTAMLEIVHAMAPGALLGFASALSETQMAHVIDGMRPAGCDIIVDDVVWPAEGAYQQGIIAIAVDTFTSVGRTYISAAGDQGNAAHATSGTWEGDFVDSGTQNAAVSAYEEQTVKLHRFGSVANNTLLATPRVLTLKWSDPLGASSNDYDLFVLDASGTTILASSTSMQSGSQDPLEAITCTPATCPAGAMVVVALYSGSPRALRLQAHGSSSGPKLTMSTAGNTSGHNAAPGTITVGAIGVANAPGGTFAGGSGFRVEDYSADGRRHQFYHLGGAAITPGNVLFGTGGGTSVAKIDLTAADGVSTATGGYNPFFGTSAAAAHAAAIAALVKSANRSATPETIRSALVNTALDIEASGSDTQSGAGIVMAAAAVRSVLSPLTVQKSFVTSQMQPGGTSTLTITIGNSNGTQLKGIALTDSYPPSIVNAPSPAAQISGAGCTGTLAATPAGTSLSLSQGVVPAYGTCTITVKVTGNVANAYVDASGTASTPIGLNTPAAMAVLTIAAMQPPSLQRAASRKVHGAAGVFDLTLSLVAASPTVEPRQGPAATLVLTFDKAITAASVDIVEGIATAVAPTFNGNDVIINLTAVGDAQYVKVALTGIASADGATGGSASVRAGFLAGDVDGNRAVSLTDLLAVNASLTRAVTSGNYLRDANASGSVSISDVLLVDSRLTRTLPAP